MYNISGLLRRAGRCLGCIRPARLAAENFPNIQKNTLKTAFSPLPCPAAAARRKPTAAHENCAWHREG